MLYVCFLFFSFFLSFHFSAFVPLFSSPGCLCMSCDLFSPSLKNWLSDIFWLLLLFTSLSLSFSLPSQLVYNAVLSSSVCHCDLFILLFLLSISSYSFSISRKLSRFLFRSRAHGRSVSIVLLLNFPRTSNTFSVSGSKESHSEKTAVFRLLVTPHWTHAIFFNLTLF